MTVAIILSVYKQDTPLALHWAMQSLLRQSYTDIILFINMDGDVRNNVQRLVLYLSSIHKNIVITRSKKNKGLSYSLNHLVDIIISEYKQVAYIARMDADDISHPERIRTQVCFLENNPEIDILGTACREFGIYNKVIIKDEEHLNITKNILKVTPFIHPSVMFRLRVFSDGNRYPQNTVLSEDLSFWLQLSLNGYKFHNLKDVLLFYRITQNTLKRRTGFWKAWSEMKERFKFLRKKNDNIFMNICYIVGHFVIKIMPIFIVRGIYRLLR